MPIDDNGAVFASAAFSSFRPDPSPSAASELLLMLLHVAQWDVCCDGDDAAAAAQSDAQAQLLFQGLGSCLVFMNDERLTIPRVRPACSSASICVVWIDVLCRSFAPASSVSCGLSSTAMLVPPPFKPASPLNPVSPPILCHSQPFHIHFCTNRHLTARVLALDASSFATVLGAVKHGLRSAIRDVPMHRWATQRSFLKKADTLLRLCCPARLLLMFSSLALSQL